MNQAGKTTLPEPPPQPLALVRISLPHPETGAPQPRYIRASRIELVMETHGQGPTFVALPNGDWHDNTCTATLDLLAVAK